MQLSIMKLGYRVSNDCGNQKVTCSGYVFWGGRFWVLTCHSSEEETSDVSSPIVVLRKSAPYVGVEVLLVGRLNNEDDVIFGFEGGDDGTITALVGYGPTVDCRNDLPFTQSNLVGKGARSNVGDYNATFNANL